MLSDTDDYEDYEYESSADESMSDGEYAFESQAQPTSRQVRPYSCGNRSARAAITSIAVVGRRSKCVGQLRSPLLASCPVWKEAVSGVEDGRCLPPDCLVYSEPFLPMTESRLRNLSVEAASNHRSALTFWLHRDWHG